MIRDYPQTDQFKNQMRESLQREVGHSRAINIAKHTNVYTFGDQDEMVYFIESGQVKLVMVSSEGRECLLAIHAVGDRGPAGNCDRNGRHALEKTSVCKVP